ncbi:hypothetical protein [Microbispora triticiradicis]|uniref:hypothetical protein n=1 Tax=Microbispora triticiradicis TaxID=2200763 RepID=UPI001AD616E0|nr:hypothetical protein [Microbispora triticiradicis]MBO4270644.1 hypothetical protein [Microbispora triticiradicis]
MAVADSVDPDRWIVTFNELMTRIAHRSAASSRVALIDRRLYLPERLLAARVYTQEESLGESRGQKKPHTTPGRSR